MPGRVESYRASSRPFYEKSFVKGYSLSIK